MKLVLIEAYNPSWPAEFLRLKEMLTGVIGDLILGVEHVGSTSVPGLAAKPIIDINVIMDSYKLFPQIKERLEAEGFIHEGNIGVEGREAFARTRKDDFMKYHLYICPKDGEALRRHLMFRDYLREHEWARDEYAALKKALADKYPRDVDTYCEKKTAFIAGILKMARAT